MAIVWDERTMGTGVESVDHEHRELIRMLNEMMAATAEGKGKQRIGEMLSFLGDYARKHFANEECVMKQRACPSAEQNQAAHQAFLRELERLQATFESDGPTIEFIMDVQQKIIDWLLTHIKGCDAQLRQCTFHKIA